MTREQKHIEAQKRALIIRKAKEYTHENIDYLDKNSNITNDQCIKIIAMLHIKKQVIADNFIRAINEAIKKMK